VLMAWWMASKLIVSLHKISASHENPLAWMELIERGNIEKKESIIRLKHIFTDRRTYYSPSRFRTLMGKNLLASCALSLLNPEDEGSNGISPFIGVKNPATALDAKLRDEMLNMLSLHTFLGEGQINRDKISEIQLPLLWDIPFCVSTPAFLRTYYGDALDFLGKERMKIIEDAENATHPDFLSGELVKTPEYMKEKEGHRVVQALASLRTYFFTSGTMPKSAYILQDNEYLLRGISDLEEEYQTLALAEAAQILDRVHAAGENEWTVIIEKQFSHIDYSKCSNKTLELIIPILIQIFLRSGHYTILQPIIRMKASNKVVRECLSRIKSVLEDIFPYIPPRNRENIRWVLNELQDITV